MWFQSALAQPGIIRRLVVLRVVPVSVVSPSAVARAGVKVGAHASTRHSRGAPAQPAHAVDAAARPRDPGYFEGQNQLESCTDLSVAAQLMGNPLGRSHQRHLIRSACLFSRDTIFLTLFSIALREAS